MGLGNIVKSHHPIRHAKSFKYAWDGVVHALLNEANFRVQILITILAIALGIYFRINTVEWSLIALAFGGLTSAELINTVIEEFIDSIVKGYDTAAKAAKDMSAGYVLINALAALAVLYFVFSQRLILALTALHVL